MAAAEAGQRGVVRLLDAHAVEVHADDPPRCGENCPPRDVKERRMTMEFTAPRSGSPLPGGPRPYFLSEGAGEKAIMIDSLFTVLLSADETDGQFGVFTMDGPKGDAIPPHSHGTHHEIFYVVRGGVTVFLNDEDGQRRVRELGPGDFGYVPAGIVHAYRVDEDHTRVLGVSTGGFE